MSKGQTFHIRPNEHGWKVDVDPEAVRLAARTLKEWFPEESPEFKNYSGWLARFLKDVIESPFDVLGHPPRQAASDPDLMYFPADETAAVSGAAHVSRKKRLIHVFRIHLRKPGKERGRR